MLNLDTHILIFALQGGLTSKERSLLSGNEWTISGIVLWEMAKLTELQRVEIDLDDPEVARILSRIFTWPVSLEVCRALRRLDFKGDPADELIAATSIVHNIPLVTRDKSIRRSKVVPLAHL